MHIEDIISICVMVIIVILALLIPWFERNMEDEITEDEMFNSEHLRFRSYDEDLEEDED